MTEDEITELLNRLIANWENEVVEFKEANNDFDSTKVGKYFSALSNEANLKGVNAAWLVFGVRNSNHQVVGTNYRLEPDRLESLKKQISDGAGSSLREIHVLLHPGGRVILFEIPPAPPGIAIGWNGHYFAREGEHTVALSDPKRDQIRNQTLATDWTAAVVPSATLNDLDPEAIARARKGFAERYPRLASDLSEWDDATFLNKARLTAGGEITRTALLLLGKETSAHLLSPHPAELTWKLNGPEPAYQHFNTPFLLSATSLAKRVRNLQVRLVPPNELIFREISKYEDGSILEALYNCIAHQDYQKNSRVIVTEHVDRLDFISVGSFFDRVPEDYMLSERVPRKYRNPFLVAAMTELNLIDHMGNGIHRIVMDQRRRFLPLPDYDLNEPHEVKLTIHGAVLDGAFTRVLMARPDLSLEDVLALDRVQKKLSLSDGAITRLRKAKLIEGRKPHFYVSAKIAAASGTKAEYIRTRAQDDAHYSRLIADHLTLFNGASRKEIDELLNKYLHESLSERQRRDKVSNLLSKMRRSGQIRNSGTQQKPHWELV